MSRRAHCSATVVEDIYSQRSELTDTEHESSLLLTESFVPVKEEPEMEPKNDPSFVKGDRKLEQKHKLTKEEPMEPKVELEAKTEDDFLTKFEPLSAIELKEECILLNDKAFSEDLAQRAYAKNTDETATLLRDQLHEYRSKRPHDKIKVELTVHALAPARSRPRQRRCRRR